MFLTLKKVLLFQAVPVVVSSGHGPKEYFIHKLGLYDFYLRVKSSTAGLINSPIFLLDITATVFFLVKCTK
jgi:hypothetical protein